MNSITNPKATMPQPDKQELMEVGQMLKNLPDTFKYMVYGLIVGLQSASEVNAAQTISGVKQSTKNS